MNHLKWTKPTFHNEIENSVVFKSYCSPSQLGSGLEQGKAGAGLPKELLAPGSVRQAKPFQEAAVSGLEAAGDGGCCASSSPRWGHRASSPRGPRDLLGRRIASCTAGTGESFPSSLQESTLFCDLQYITYVSHLWGSRGPC